MQLSAPTIVVFGISLVVALLAALSAFASVQIPWVSANEFLTMTLAWVLLAAGAIFKGL